MKVLITRGDRPSVWQIDPDQRASRLALKCFDEHDLCPDLKVACRANLPYELVEKIMVYLFKIYLESCNFDLCTDLLFFSRNFASLIYRSIYERDLDLDFETIYYRLVNTFIVLQNLHDDYLTAFARLDYPCIKLTSTRDPGSGHQPWDFTHDIVITNLTGVVVDLTETLEQVRFGSRYGETVWFSGNHRNGFFDAASVRYPIFNLQMVDVFDTLCYVEPDVCSKNFFGFFSLMRRAFGKTSGLYVMVKEDEDVANPFITRSDLFLEIE